MVGSEAWPVEKKLVTNIHNKNVMCTLKGIQDFGFDQVTPSNLDCTKKCI